MSRLRVLAVVEVVVVAEAAAVGAAAAGEGVTKGVWRVVEVIRIPMPFPEPWEREALSFLRVRTR